MSDINRTAKLPKKTEDIYYVSANNGNDANSGKSPTQAFATIGAATTAMSDGDQIIVGEGTYNEDVVLDHVGITLTAEPGVVITGTGTSLTVSGNRCMVQCPDSSILCDPAASQTGVLVTGNFVYLNNIRVKCDSSADIGFDIGSADGDSTDGSGTVLNNCRTSSPLTAAFKVQADKVKLDGCCTGGNSGDSSIGFWITNSCDKTRIKNCGSQGNETAGFQIDSGVTNAVVDDSYSGVGDGSFTNDGTDCIYSNFHYDGAVDVFNTPVVKTTTFSGAATTYNIFKITGSVRVQDIVGHVTTAIPNTSSDIHLEVYSTGGTVDLTNSVGAPDLDQAPVGTLVVRTDDSSEALELASSATPAIIEYGARAASVEVNIVADEDQTTYIRLNITAALASGAIHWHCNYRPITDRAFVEPA